ncbi:MAG TPA: NUDIX hydrolase [Beijerinckiaceae bacterium]|nr:NUDIX hydrolase [Beijerinckiaceae bacterium]
MSAIAVVPLAGLSARRLDEPWPWALRNRDLVAAHWAALTGDNPALYNGRVLVRRRHVLEAGRLDLGYVETDYASFIAFRDHGFPDPESGNAFAMAALRGADGAFLLGRMGEHTANAGKVYFPAGTPGPEDVLPDGTVDLAGSVLRELEEETGLRPGDVAMDEAWTATIAGARTALMREVRVPEPAEAARARIRAFLAGQARPELSDIVIVRTVADIDEAMPPFMQAYLRAALQR